METKSLERLEKLHPEIRKDAIKAYKEAVRRTPVGIHPYITETVRTFAQQDALYAIGRTKPGNKVTNAKGGQSLHNYALALDFVLKINGKVSWIVDKNWLIVVDCFEKYGFEWGGSWKRSKDFPHFQKTFGYTWQLLKVKYLNKVFISGTKFVVL